jgi:hypothetical protein
MRGGKADEFSGRYDLGFLPESREMLLIARYQIVRTGSIGAFQKHIVVEVAWDIQAAGRNDRMTVVFDELQQLQPEDPCEFSVPDAQGLRRIPRGWIGTHTSGPVG